MVFTYIRITVIHMSLCKCVHYMELNGQTCSQPDGWTDGQIDRLDRNTRRTSECRCIYPFLVDIVFIELIKFSLYLLSLSNGYRCFLVRRRRFIKNPALYNFCVLVLVFICIFVYVFCSNSIISSVRFVSILILWTPNSHSMGCYNTNIFICSVETTCVIVWVRVRSISFQ